MRPNRAAVCCRPHPDRGASSRSRLYTSHLPAVRIHRTYCSHTSHPLLKVICPNICVENPPSTSPFSARRRFVKASTQSTTHTYERTKSRRLPCSLSELLEPKKIPFFSPHHLTTATLSRPVCTPSKRLPVTTTFPA